MIIAVDFDGTIVMHEYPEIGKQVPYAITSMKELISSGHKLILLTMRSGEHLEQAVDYCKENGVEFWAVNENPEQKEWTSSNKVYAHKYIDDAAIGCPLLVDLNAERPYVDWELVIKYFNA